MISTLEFKNAVATQSPTNHVFVADVSGSMYSVLPKIRAHLKNNLASLVKPNDTVSIIYFSSKGQCGSVFVGEKVNSINDLTNIHAAIDKFLRPIGCTGFVEPLNLSADIAKQLSDVNGNLNSLIFMTDGYDNEWQDAQIINACVKLPMVFSDITFLEYGYYCNRPLLEKMAEATNALHTFTETYADYEPAFEAVISANTAKRIEVNVGDATHVVYIDGDRIYTVNATNSIVLIPESISTVWAISNDAIETVDTLEDEQLLYVVLYNAIHTMNPDLAWKVLKKLGDIKLIKAYDNCFTKQDYSNAKDMISDAVIDSSKRFLEGVNYNMVPDENAITLSDVIKTLINSNAMIDIKSEYFSYNRTGRASVQKDDDTIDKLSEQIANASTVEERKELAMQLALHEEWTPKFENTETLVPMNKLVGNGSRPNISIQTDMKGVVAIPLSAQVEHGLPSEIATKIYRNYTVVKDGIINMKSVPVIVPVETLAELDALAVPYTVYTSERSIVGEVAINVDLTSAPLVNRAMTKGLSGETFMHNAVKLQGLKARQKVLKFYREELVGKVNAVGLTNLYGADAAKFLSENGIRDYGFAPKTTRAESTDMYMSKELNVKIKGLSALPAVNAVLKKIATGKKLNAADHLMYIAIQDFDTAKSLYGEDVEGLKGWITTQAKQAIDSVRVLESDMSKVMYGIVVAKSWFCDMDLEETSKTVVENCFSFDVTIVLEEKAVKI